VLTFGTPLLNVVGSKLQLRAPQSQNLMWFFPHYTGQVLEKTMQGISKNGPPMIVGISFCQVWVPPNLPLRKNVRGFYDADILWKFSYFCYMPNWFQCPVMALFQAGHWTHSTN
jgi:hypothetical protein